MAGFEVGQKQIIEDIVDSSGLQPTLVAEVITNIMDYLVDGFNKGYSFRLQGLGILSISKTNNGNWVGGLHKKPYMKGRLRVKYQKHLIEHLIGLNALSEDPETTYKSFWQHFCDAIVANLKKGYAIKIRDVGTIERGMIDPIKDARWHITPLTQSKLDQMEFNKTIRDTEDY